MCAERPDRPIGELSPDGTRMWGGRRWEPLWLLPVEVVEAVRVCFGRDMGAASLMVEGLMNQSWRVESPAGAYILRVSRPELARERVRYEHAVVTRLHDEVREVVAPLPGSDGDTLQAWQGRSLTLFPYVEGNLGTSVEPAIRCRRSATMLARIHNAGIDVEIGQSPGERAVDERRTMWSTVRPVLERDLPPSDEVDQLFGFFDREEAELLAWLDGVRRSGRRPRRGVIHGDFNPRNLIFDQDRLVAVIDWESSQLDLLAFEVAGVAFGTPDPLAFWHCYLDAGGPLAADDIELLGGLARIGRLVELCFTVDDDRAKPWALPNLRNIASDQTKLRTGLAELGLSAG